MKLKNRIAVITGGNSAIGLATAKELKQLDARVVIIGRNPEAVAQAALEIGGDTLGVTADVGRVADLDTHLWQDGYGHKETLEQVAAGILAGVPLKRFGTSEEIAKSVAFLASDDASFITDQELVADGGMSLF
jgi:NAD(P)-dependent dehydrogenase (short-subunit alcohol dehydrogenase family)